MGTTVFLVVCIGTCAIALAERSEPTPERNQFRTGPPEAKNMTASTAASLYEGTDR